MRKRHFQLPEISVFFPVFNEAANLEEAVEQALAVLPKIAKKYEILIINDGSRDASLPIAKRLSRKHTRVRVVSQSNHGYGGALKRGIRESKYDWVFYSDADLQFDIAELRKFVRFTKKYDLVIGFRKTRAEGWYRQIFASLLKIWNRLFLGFPLAIRDIDCAFKLVHRDVLRSIEPLFSDGAMISTELLLKSYRANFSIKQVGVTHYVRRAGTPTGNNWSVISKAIIDTFLLKKHLFKQTTVGQFATSQKRYWTTLPNRLAFN